MVRPRIHSEERVVTAVRIPVPLRDELHRVAASRDVSVNYLINRAIEKLLEELAAQPDPLLLELSADVPVSTEPVVDLTQRATS